MRVVSLFIDVLLFFAPELRVVTFYWQGEEHGLGCSALCRADCQTHGNSLGLTFAIPVKNPLEAYCAGRKPVNLIKRQ
ncbi:hypothetical protein CHU93_00115 [Sandarakinorhabdus cyanobacteriorum]|uniref:Uncharacterized protein n=1 Tax=Sandarakinorhabdus cyanobacteriorum TaxID=1981098 RepID=A0A255Z955_9SPHN|nr:hypothetical protein CHU93_00115 [Sandarakinorhabdus cyanobacteriorum]